MKLYQLSAVINSKEIKHKVFKTRAEADRYLSKILDQYNLKVEDVIYRNHNHDQEFVCDYYNRIFVNRI